MKRSRGFWTIAYSFWLMLKPFAASALLAAAMALLAGAGPAAQSRDSARAAYDQVLEINVRDGLVYYRALKASRGPLDRYVASLAAAPVASMSRNDQIAFWLNAYNALVLKTVIDNYPPSQRSREYPAHSVRQVPGAFERLTHQVGGRALTLDQIEQTVLAGFGDPRVFLAIGRGAVGGGRLRSEAFTGETLEAQLLEVAKECVTRAQCFEIQRQADTVRVSSIFSWRRAEFEAAYADKAAPVFAARSPIERAVLALVQPTLLTSENEYLEKNTFKLAYTNFDWSLNDLTGRSH
jgi:hypothetical protein